MQASDFYDIVSGRRRDIRARLCRLGLALAEPPMRVGVALRNQYYDRNRTAVQRVRAPVVSIGNLTLGGTGKTPMVKWVARWLRRRDVRVTVVSRGYGAHAGGPNDEALELEQALPDVPHLQHRDRVAAAKLAIEEFWAQVILLDDGFQHRRIARDVDVVLLDATAPFGFEHVFPRGALREPATALRRADVVCLTRSDQVTRDERAGIADRVRRISPGAIWCESTHAPQRLINAAGESLPIDGLTGARVLALLRGWQPHRVFADRDGDRSSTRRNPSLSRSSHLRSCGCREDRRDRSAASCRRDCRHLQGPC
jgi:tetraacyldisaccharide 4'-kinase